MELCLCELFLWTYALKIPAGILHCNDTTLWFPSMLFQLSEFIRSIFYLLYRYQIQIGIDEHEIAVCDTVSLCAHAQRPHIQVYLSKKLILTQGR